MQVVHEHHNDLLRAAAAAQTATDARLALAEGRTREQSMTLRLDRPADARALAQLAALSSQRRPSSSCVVGEVDGRLVAAVPLAGGPALADPFVPTAQLVPLLELRAAQLRRAGLDLVPRRRRLQLLRRTG